MCDVSIGILLKLRRWFEHHAKVGTQTHSSTKCITSGIVPFNIEKLMATHATLGWRPELQPWKWAKFFTSLDNYADAYSMSYFWLGR